MTRGLEGVVVADTGISRVLGEAGRLTYAGYEIEDLAEHTTFEEVCHLLWESRLPDREAFDALTAELRAAATLDPRVLDIVRTIAPSMHPMAALRTAVSALAAFDPDAEDNSPEASRRKAARLTAQALSASAAIARVRAGQTPVAPDPDLDLAANFLYMLRGTRASAIEARTLDVAFVLHAEHGMNASTFTARVAAATLTDMHSAVTAAIGALKGPLHGGANEGVMRMLLEIGTPERAEEWVMSALERGARIMGFGHRVYKTLDPRAPILKSMVERLESGSKADVRWLRVADRVQAVMGREMERRGKRIYANVDFFSAPVYYTLGIPVELFTNLFACARMPGWTAHIMEQQANNRLIRPAAEYTGPDGLVVQPIDGRSDD